MKIDWVAKALEGIPGVRKDGAAHLIPEDLDLSLFIALPSEVVTVPRAARIEATGELVMVETRKGERYHFPIETVAGLKSEQPEKRAASHGAGFR